MSYEIITVDWNPEQTKVWKYWVKKNCPTATILTVADTRPISWCKNAGKINALKANFATKNVIYLDTDVIVTKDLSFLFDNMDYDCLAASSIIPQPPFSVGSGPGRRWFALLRPVFRLRKEPIHFNSGMIVIKGFYPDHIGLGMEIYLRNGSFRRVVRGYDLLDEVAFSYFISEISDDINIYHLPFEIHGNLTHGKVFFGDSKLPAVIHYHKPERLKQVGLYHMYEEACHTNL